LLDQARAEADRLLVAAQEEAKAIREGAEAEGRRAGFETGRAEGRAIADAQAKQEIGHLREILDNLLAERVRILSSAEPELVDLALAIARKVIGDAASGQREALAYMVRQAVEQLGHTGPFQIHLHPTDVQRVAADWPTGESPDWKLVPDERIAPGGCIVSCGPGQVDARPDTQLDLIQRTFRSVPGDIR
jgi:flagellar assembly protein FliH